VTLHSDDLPMILTATGRDQPGLTAAITTAVTAAGGNIIELGQQTDPYVQLYGCRIAITGDLAEEQLVTELDALGVRLGISWTLHDRQVRPRLVIACSAALHCVTDLLGRIQTGDLRCDLVGIVSDKPAVADLAARMAVPLLEVPVGEDRVAQEQAFAEAVASFSPDLVVLARYMRILPAWITDAYEARMINIHHSTLPAFPGANPRRRAHERGVKMIGATAHYVTAELDEGPIIDQDVIRIGNHTLSETIQLGEDVERLVLARAIRLHLDHRVMVFGDRTCVFG